jgi:hypothetical protein
MKVVRSTGFEPVTVRLEGGCSIQLSYERIAGFWYQAQHTKSKSGCEIVQIIGTTRI